MGDRRRRSTRCKRYFSVVSCAGPGKGRPAGRAFEEAHRPEAAILLERSHRLAPSHHLPFALRLSNGGFHSHPVRGWGSTSSPPMEGGAFALRLSKGSPPARRGSRLSAACDRG